MSIWEALILGALQGLTEFLPISSSAHLRIAEWLLGIEHTESLAFFHLSCHAATACELLYFFRMEILHYLHNGRQLLLFILALLPLIPAYLLMRSVVGGPSLAFLGPCLCCTGVVLWLGGLQRWNRSDPKTLQTAAQHRLDLVWIGAMQGLALLPGISRSASTMAMAQILGWNRLSAVRFSFLLAIPTMFAATGLDLIQLFKKGMKSETGMEPVISIEVCLAGGLAALIVGFFVIRPAIAFLERRGYKPFIWYCLLVGFAFTLMYRAYGIFQP